MEALIKTKEQPSILWEKYHSDGCKTTRQHLFDLYLKFAKFIAVDIFTTRAWTGLDFNDCMQYASVGLLEAIDRYDHNRNANFETYATYRIRGAILNGIEKYSEEFDIISHQRKLAKERTQALATHINHESSDALLDSLIDITIEMAFGHMIQAVQEITPPTDESPYNNPKRLAIQRQLSDLIGALPHDQQTVIRNHYCHDMAFADIADILAISRARISQLHNMALKTLRTKFDNRVKLDACL